MFSPLEVVIPFEVIMDIIPAQQTESHFNCSRQYTCHWKGFNYNNAPRHSCPFHEFCDYPEPDTSEIRSFLRDKDYDTTKQKFREMIRFYGNG
jgi:hypothetical protein